MILSRTRNRLVVSILLLSFAGAGPSFAGGTATIRNIPPTPHFAPDGTSLADLAGAIRLAADAERWQIIAEVPGVMQASVRVRSHEAVVTIGFDDSNFWIQYQDSINLDYKLSGRRAHRTRREIKGPRIHSNYNIWVDRLAKRIATHAKVPPKANLIETGTTRNPIFIADELEKLSALRERGVLTQEEFDQQKAKLLAR